MTYSTTYPTTWARAGGELRLELIPADVSVADAFYAEEYVTIVQPDELGLLWPVRLRIERDEGGFVVSDDFTEVYGEGRSHEEAVAAYRAALSGLRRVLAARQDSLTPELMQRLTILQSIVPPGD